MQMQSKSITLIDFEQTNQHIIDTQYKLQRKLQNTDQLHKKSAFLNKFRPEQRTKANLS